MRYLEHKPDPSLSRFVECFWTLEDAGKQPHPSSLTPGVEAERILPDGCVEMILNFGAPFLEYSNDGQSLQPMHFVVGQMTRSIMITPTGSVELIGVRFQPGGTLPFFPVPLHELTNRVVELSFINRKLDSELGPRLGNISAIAKKLAALEKTLTQHVAGKDTTSLSPELATQILRHYGRITVDELASAAGISGRQLERRFMREVGIGPKMLSRILRFQRVFQAVESNDDGWAGVAADCGYYDQAHLIKDFQQFAGQTPSVVFSDTNALTHSFTRKHRMSDFSNTRL